MASQEEMKDRANELIENLNSSIQESIDIINDYYKDCGSVNGMSYKYEVCKLWLQLEKVKEQMESINKRVVRHIDETTDEEDFRQRKLHQSIDSERDTDSTPTIDDVLKVSRLKH